MGLGLIGIGATASSTLTEAGKVAKEPAVQLLGLAAVMYAAHLLIRDIK